MIDLFQFILFPIQQKLSFIFLNLIINFIKIENYFLKEFIFKILKLFYYFNLLGK